MKVEIRRRLYREYTQPTATSEQEATRVVRECLSKKRYHTRSLAKIAKKASERHFGDELNTYQCPHCRGHHLTSQKAR